MKIAELFNTVLDAVLPRRHRTVRTALLQSGDLPLSPTSHSLLGTTITTLMEYGNESVSDTIQSLKYDGAGHAAHLCAAVLADYLREEIASHKLYSQKPIVLVPVPLHKARARERGFNQIELVLAALPKDFKDGTLSRINTKALSRTRETKQQTRLSRSERLGNVAGAFEVQGADTVRGSYIYLIDDVTTTGATLVNAGTPLRRAGATVSLIALARA